MKTRIIAAIGCATLVAAAPASAQTVDRGATTFELSRTAATSLKQAGVTVTVGRPARRVSTAVVLPVTRGFLSGTRYLEHAGTLGFRRGTRKIVFKDLRTSLGSTVRVSGTAGGRRVGLLTLSRRTPAVSSVSGTALLPGTKATLTTRAATLVRRALKLKTLSRALGTVNVNAALQGRSAGSGPSAPGGGTTTAGGGTGTPGGGPTGSAPGGDAPSNAPVTSTEPPLLARPGDAHAAPASITWRPSPSWLAYLYSGNGPSNGTVVADGATETGVPYETSFGYVETGTSWATPGGVAGLYFAGSLTFTYPEHTIDQVARNPEIELNGAASRAIFRVDGTSLDASARNKRMNMFALDLGAASRSETATTITYADIPARVTAESAGGFFGGFYEAGTQWGSFTVSYAK